jgi:hypothetical protein
VGYVRLLSSRRMRFLGVAVAGLLVFDAAAAYQVGVRARRPPSFRKGGRFLEAGGGRPQEPVTEGDATTTTSTAGAESSSSTGGRTTTTRSKTAAASAALASSSSRTGAPASSSAAGSTLPANGTYTWNVSGTEAASGFGSRSFPPTMTMVAHRDPGLKPEEVVLDSTYSSNHTEREIVAVESTGIYFDFEGGQVRFGPSAQTNQGDYNPPLLQVP